ncbi:MAG TPA: hypothetical protein VGK73_14030 [Polyangiaceae bacterium]
MTKVRTVLAEQLAANLSSSSERAWFAGHRRRLTQILTRDVPLGSELTLCVLGAGNANDLDLEVLAARYRAIHLVDIDPEAVERAHARESSATRERLVRHAPIDVSGTLDRAERWAALQVTPAELAGHAEETSARLLAKLAGPFDVVVSACLLTQLQLGLLTVLGDRHPLFEAARYTVSSTHLAVLSRLARAGGRAVFVTDLSANDLAPEIEGAGDAELPELVERLVAGGRVIRVADPRMIREIVRESPGPARELELLPGIEAWLWQNGASRTFLVYALEARKARA